MNRAYRTAHRLRIAAQDEPVRLRGWPAIAATLVLQGIILASQGLGGWAIAGTLATLALPLLGLERARRRVTPVTRNPDPTPPDDPPPGRAGHVRLPRANTGTRHAGDPPDPADQDPDTLYTRWQQAVRPLVEAAERAERTNRIAGNVPSAIRARRTAWGTGDGSAEV